MWEKMRYNPDTSSTEALKQYVAQMEQGEAPQRETPAASEEKPDILAAENQIFVDPNGVKYRIGIEKGFGKKTYWRTERMDNGEWIPNNSSSYPKFENAQGEFAACIRVHSLVPLEEEADSAPETLPADAGGTTEALATVPDTLPAFDYSGLDAEARDTLHVAEKMIKSARQKFICEVADAVALAHDALCGVVRNSDNSKHGNRGESTFFAWCASVGLSRSTAYQLLQVSDLISASTPNEQTILAQASPSLLYAAAKPSAPAEAVDAVKSGDITTYKEYQEVVQRIKLLETQNQSLLHSCETERGKAETAEQKAREATAREEEALAAAHRYHVEKEDAEAQRNAMIDREADWARRIADAQAAQRSAEQERNAARTILQKAKRRTGMLENEHSATVALLEETRAELDALRAQPIEVAVAEPDPSEIERLANEKAEAMTAQLQEQLTELAQKNLESSRRAWNVASADFDMVEFAAQTIETAWLQAAPAWNRMELNVRFALRGNLERAIDGVTQALRACEEAADGGA